MTLRSIQRRKQNLLTKQLEEASNGQRQSTSFCKLCKLIFTQSRSEHNQSDDHKAICQFLTPKCDVCKLPFPTPMSYEKHLCSIKHLKTELYPESNGKLDGDEPEVDTTEDNFDFSLEDLVTVDEVGDDAEDAEDMHDKGLEDADQIKEEVKDEVKQEIKEESQEAREVVKMESRNYIKKENDYEIKDDLKSEIKDELKKEINYNENEIKDDIKDRTECETDEKIDPSKPVGHEYIRQVLMFYCDLCHKYLPKLNQGDQDELVDTHCMTPAHQNSFVKKEAEKRVEEQAALKMLAKVTNAYQSNVFTV